MTYQLLTTISENKVTRESERRRRSGERGRGRERGREERERVNSGGGNMISL